MSGFPAASGFNLLSKAICNINRKTLASRQPKLNTRPSTTRREVLSFHTG